MRPFATLSAAAIALGFYGAASARGATGPRLLKRGQETHETAAPARAQEQIMQKQTAPRALAARAR